MNNYDKMRRTNALVKKKLKNMGFSDIVMFPHTRFSKDVYGFDCVCKKKIEACELFEIYWVQIKTGRIKLKEKTKLENFCFCSGEKGLIVERIKYKEKYKKKKGSYMKYKIKVTEID